MTVDVTAIAALGRDAMESAILTSGVRVDVFLDSDDQDETVDFDTLEVTDPTPESASLRNVPALIAVEGTPGEPVGRDREQYPTTFRVAFLPSVTAVVEGAVIVPRRCPDPQLVSARLRVTAVLDDAFAISRPVRARRL